VVAVVVAVVVEVVVGVVVVVGEVVVVVVVFFDEPHEGLRHTLFDGPGEADAPGVSRMAEPTPAANNSAPATAKPNFDILIRPPLDVIVPSLFGGPRRPPRSLTRGFQAQ
jgi:hypothetical protein